MSSPLVTVTVLFTDIEGSTRLWEADPDWMRTAVAGHDRILRGVIESHGGLVFSTGGDGFGAAFSGAGDAVAAAVEAQEALGEVSVAKCGALRVRMGLHTGEVEQRNGDYFGTEVNRAARLMAVAHGGQTVCSATVADLAGTGLPAGVCLVDLGEHRLRDLTRPVKVFQVGAGAFSPLRSVDAYPGNLPLQTTSFVGREAELDDVTDALRAHRLVTLTGVGGVGKTRLALQAAAALVADFTEGVFLVELAPVGAAASVPDAVAAVLGVIQQPGLTLAESVGRALEGRQRLLVIDNCEHVLDAAAELVEKVLDCSATVKVLAASREGLGVSGEHLRPVRPLAARDRHDEAVVLFFERARMAVPDFAAVGAQEEAVVDICQRLDGIPLAIELAASRMVSMSPGEVCGRLGDRFRLLSGSRRSLDRHQTLRNTVQWSYDLLSGPERQVLRRCSVFSGGFELSAAVAVVAESDQDEYTVIDLLDSLVRKSLLECNTSSGSSRYSMLETVRQFAEEQLESAGESDRVRDLHTRHYASVDSRVLAIWDGPHQLDAYRWLDRETPNLRTAFRWAAQRGELDTACRIVVAAATIGDWSAREEPAGWAQELLGTVRASDHRDLGLLCAVIARQAARRGRVDDGVRFADEAIGLFANPRFNRGPFDEGPALAAPAYGVAGRSDRWVEVLQDYIDAAETPNLFARSCLVALLLTSGRIDAAVQSAAGVVEAAEEAGNPAQLAFALTSYSLVASSTDRPAEALLGFQRALVLATDSGSRWVESQILYRLAHAELVFGDKQAGLELIGRSIQDLQDAGNRIAMDIPLGSLIAHLEHTGQLEPAAIIAGATRADWVSNVYPEIDQAQKRLRSRLGADAYDALTRTGRAMGTPDVVAYALDQIERTRKPPSRGSDPVPG